MSYYPMRAQRITVRTVNHDQDHPNPNDPANNREHRRVLRAIDYIKQHYRDRISPEALSLEVGLSVARLQRGFKSGTGHTVAGFLEMTRIEESKVLLAHSDNPIRNIAKEVGFKTQSHFGGIFKKLTGITPLQYRNYYG